MSDTDLELLSRYTRHHAEEAFAEIVRRHLALIYSAALRHVRSPQLAEEVAQSTFLKLARHAPRLAPDTIVSAWLYQVTRREAIDVVRREARRQLREQIATEMNAINATASDWTHIEPLLDEAMHALDEIDRAAVLLRYFENKSLREVGQSLGASEDAAQKCVSRAVERLREFFTHRGVTVGVSGLATMLSAHAVQAAPVALAATIASAVSAAALAATGAGSGLFGSMLQACRTKPAVGFVATVLIGTATFLAMRSPPPAGRDALAEAARATAPHAVQNTQAAAAATQQVKQGEEPGRPEPLKLLLTVARARRQMVSGTMELLLSTDRFENGRKETRPPARLKVLFDGPKLRFDSVKRDYRYPFFEDYESAEAKDLVRRVASMAKDEAVRAGCC